MMPQKCYQTDYTFEISLRLYANNGSRARRINREDTVCKGISIPINLLALWRRWNGVGEGLENKRLAKSMQNIIRLSKMYKTLR